MTPAVAASKATALLAAWRTVLGCDPPALSTFLLPLAQADFETGMGAAWPPSRNWGACDLRGLTPAEQAANLPAGTWLHKDGTYDQTHRPDDVGVLQTDSHPGGTTFRVWFAAFPDDVAGAAYFLRIVCRSSKAVLLDPNASPLSYATALYLGCYYEGVHTGARPCGHRTLPLNAGEAANVNSYMTVVASRASVLAPLLAQAGWALPAPVAPPPHVADPSGPADESTDPHDAETLPGA